MNSPLITLSALLKFMVDKWTQSNNIISMELTQQKNTNFPYYMWGAVVLLIFISIIIFVHCEHIPNLCVPMDLTDGLNICLGDNIKELDFYDEILTSSSTGVKYLEYDKNEYFTRLYIYTTRFKKIVKGISLDRIFNSYNTSSDSIAKEIIKICTNYYGVPYIIFKLDYSGDPIIIWEIPKKGFITFIYTPLKRVQYVKGRIPEYIYSFSLEISSSLKKIYKNINESKICTKESLGLE